MKVVKYIKYMCDYSNCNKIANQYSWGGTVIVLCPDHYRDHIDSQ